MILVEDIMVYLALGCQAGRKCKFFQWRNDEICERGKVLGCLQAQACTITINNLQTEKQNNGNI